MCEPLREKKHSFVHYNKYKLTAPGKKEKIGEENIYGFKIEDVKSAVDFYKKYAEDKGFLYLNDEHPEIMKQFDENLDITAYRKWLFDYCFGDVI